VTKIGIITYETDLHGHAVKQALDRRSDVQTFIYSVDSVILNGGLNWSSEHSGQGYLRSLSGECFKPSDLDLIWWRRINQPLSHPDWLTDPIEKDFIAQEWRSALLGLLNDEFRGIWINDPVKDLRAGNKLHQLTMAKQAGLSTPRTLISQEPEHVREFCREMGGRVVAKKIAGTQLRHTVSVVVGIDDLRDDQMIRLCPAIYQEIIHSRRHLRVNCFGDAIFATLIESDVFDWRRDLNVPFSEFELDTITRKKLHRLLEIAGLEMGIMDFVLDDGVGPVWLEINPQGQFLFCEALSGQDLTTPFADFLLREVAAGHSA
jgi:hypothetical protein